jgi:hypothetical protein
MFSLTLKEEYIYRVFENRVLKRIYGPKRDEVTEAWRNCVIMNFIICTIRQIYNDQIKEDAMEGRVRRIGEIRARLRG